MKEKNKNQLLALLGFFGGFIFQIADFFIFLHRDITGDVPDVKAWENMPMWRFEVSVWLSVFASPFILAGAVSLYRMIKRTCGNRLGYMPLVSMLGVTGLVFAHFMIGCIEPMIYKTMLMENIDIEKFSGFDELLKVT